MQELVSPHLHQAPWTSRLTPQALGSQDENFLHKTCSNLLNARHKFSSELLYNGASRTSLHTRHVQAGEHRVQQLPCLGVLHKSHPCRWILSPLFPGRLRLDSHLRPMKPATLHEPIVASVRFELSTLQPAGVFIHCFFQVCETKLNLHREVSARSLSRGISPPMPRRPPLSQRDRPDRCWW